jgi:hypothetical protein
MHQDGAGAGKKSRTPASETGCAAFFLRVQDRKNGFEDF